MSLLLLLSPNLENRLQQHLHDLMEPPAAAAIGLFYCRLWLEDYNLVLAFVVWWWCMVMRGAAS